MRVQDGEGGTAFSNLLSSALGLPLDAQEGQSQDLIADPSRPMPVDIAGVENVDPEIAAKAADLPIAAPGRCLSLN